mgnify:CR=1 FL=1
MAQRLRLGALQSSHRSRVAEILGVTRPQGSRLLKRARAGGVVEIGHAGDAFAFDNLTIGASGQYVQTKGSGVDRGNALGGIGLSALRQPPEFNARDYFTEAGLHRSWRFPNPGPNCASTGAAACTRGFDNPFYGIYENENTQETGRYFGNVTVNWRPLGWLQLNYTLGGDYNSDDRMFAQGFAASGTTAGAMNRWQFYDRVLERVRSLPGVDAVAVAARAAEAGVAAVPGTLFFPDGRGGDALRLSFSLVDEERIDEGIARLGSLL